MTTLAEGPSAQSEEALLEKAAVENFPVALFLLPKERREDLLSVYRYARLVDDVGDEGDLGPAERLALLDRLEEELDAAFAGRAVHPVFSRLSATITRRGLERKPFADLIEANRLDQEVTSYPTFEDLIGYCRLSADPVGRLVLAVFSESGEELVRLSDLICSALQVVEHLQDVPEDATRGRVYLPEEDLRRFGVDASLLAGPVPAGGAPDAFRRLLSFEVARARAMLEEGSLLVGAVRSSSAALAVSGFAGGGLAQLEALERAGYDVWHGPVKAHRTAVLARAASLFRTRRVRPGRGRAA